MSLPTLIQAQQLFELACQRTDPFNIKNGLPEGISRRHYLLVAQNAQKIAAHTKHLNPEKAYILGLLHDYGEYIIQENGCGFHGTVGYDEMMRLGYDEVARACVSHSFFEEKIAPENYTSYDPEGILRAAEIIKQNPPDDYDRLVQISDLMVKGDVLSKIEDRLDYVVQRYKVPLEQVEPKKQSARALKAYFDKLCGQDIYKIVGITND